MCLYSCEYVTCVNNLTCVCGCSFLPDPAGGAYSARDLLAGFSGRESGQTGDERDWIED